jgi:hypothetical protein
MSFRKEDLILYWESFEINLYISLLPGIKKGLTAFGQSFVLMVRLAGFEPAAYGLEVRCSIHLSYRRIE